MTDDSGVGTAADRQRTVGAVLLAAGESTRYEDGNKLLATVDGTSVVCVAAETLLASPVDDVVVITGHEADRVRGALDGLDVEFRHNPDYAQGQSTSVREGVAAARERGWDAALFALGDMPFVASETVSDLLAVDEADDGTIHAPAHDGQRGNPVLFDARHFDALAGVDGDRGGRHLIEESPGTILVETDDRGVRRDIDRVEDFDG